MKNAYVAVIATLIAATPLLSAEKAPEVSNMGNVKGGDSKAAHSIIDKKCTKCHSGAVIDRALKDKKDMLRIQREMEKRGAKLNAKEQEVLGIFWKQQSPLKQVK